MPPNLRSDRYIRSIVSAADQNVPIIVDSLLIFIVLRALAGLSLARQHNRSKADGLHTKLQVLAAFAGTATLFQYGAFGLLVAFGQLFGGLAKGLAMLSMDDEFIVRFRGAPLEAQARVLHGLQTFGVGLLEGVTGEPRHLANILLFYATRRADSLSGDF